MWNVIFNNIVEKSEYLIIPFINVTKKANISNTLCTPMLFNLFCLVSPSPVNTYKYDFYITNHIAAILFRSYTISTAGI